jgi:hypothetical protein
MIVGFVKGKVANVQPFVPPEFGVKGEQGRGRLDV